jgi:hypothetical protein
LDKFFLDTFLQICERRVQRRWQHQYQQQGQVPAAAHLRPGPVPGQPHLPSPPDFDVNKPELGQEEEDAQESSCVWLANDRGVDGKRAVDELFKNCKSAPLLYAER